MPASLPSQVTQTVNGGDLYVPQANVSEPVGEVVYYNLVASASTQQGALVDFSLTSPAPGTPLPNSPIGTGRKFPIGTYLVKLSTRLAMAPNGFARSTFVISWDGLQLFGGGSNHLRNDFTVEFAINVNPGGSGAFNILSWNAYGLTNPSQLQCEIVLISQDQGTQFAINT